MKDMTNELTEEQAKRLDQFFRMSDWDFYEKYVADAPLEVQAEFLNDNPDFSGNVIKIGLSQDVWF